MTATAKKPRKSASTPALKARPKPQGMLAKEVAAKTSRPPKAHAPAAGNESAAAQKTTKQERVLALLSRADGASIDEIMKATVWQQHSVRGLLAGTVKKKLGFTLVSSNDDRKPRRYRIDKRRGR
jgi:hypothetical protein